MENEAGDGGECWGAGFSEEAMLAQETEPVKMGVGPLVVGKSV